MSVYIVAHKEDAPDMLKYMFNIREAAQNRVVLHGALMMSNSGCVKRTRKCLGP